MAIIGNDKVTVEIIREKSGYAHQMYSVVFLKGSTEDLELSLITICDNRSLVDTVRRHFGGQICGEHPEYRVKVYVD